jgi:hypothetical protein
MNDEAQAASRPGPADHLALQSRTQPDTSSAFRKFATFFLLYPALNLGLGAAVAYGRWGAGPDAIILGLGCAALVIAAALLWRRDRRWQLAVILLCLVGMGPSGGIPFLSLAAGLLTSLVIFLRTSPASKPAA